MGSSKDHRIVKIFLAPKAPSNFGAFVGENLKNEGLIGENVGVCWEKFGGLKEKILKIVFFMDENLGRICLPL